MRRPLLRRSAVAAAGLCLLGTAQAMTLAEAFDAALAHDPQYRAAVFDLDSARENLPIARASMMPQVQFTASNAEVSGTREFPNALNQDVSVRVDYTAPQAQLALRQPIFNYENLSRIRQAEASTRAAEATFRSRALALVDRLGSAYMQALAARSVMAVAEAEMAAGRALLVRAEQRFIRGEGTRTDEAQARANLELARTRETDSRDQFELALTRLRRIAGRPASWMNELVADYRPAAEAIEPLQHWLDRVEQGNPLIESRREAVAAARAAVQRNRAGHMPRLDLVASVGRSRNESLSNLNQSSTLKTVGIQLAVPLFSGGAVSAGVRQAEADLARVEQELRAEFENLALDVQRYHAAAASGASRIDAYREAIAASRTALDGMTRARDAGLATNADVLDAQTRLYTALRDASQARYEYLAARMRLLLATGMPTQQVVDAINALLSTRTEWTSAALLPQNR